MLAAMASFDRSGRMVINATACQMPGLANGPWNAARVIRPHDYGNVLVLGIVLSGVSLFVFPPPVVMKEP
jgi:hypothetical protein